MEDQPRQYLTPEEVKEAPQDFIDMLLRMREASEILQEAQRLDPTITGFRINYGSMRDWENPDFKPTWEFVRDGEELEGCL